MRRLHQGPIMRSTGTQKSSDKEVVDRRSVGSASSRGRFGRLRGKKGGIFFLFFDHHQRQAPVGSRCLAPSASGFSRGPSIIRGACG